MVWLLALPAPIASEAVDVAFPRDIVAAADPAVVQSEEEPSPERGDAELHETSI